MNKSDPPTSHGIFKPVGHTLIAFHTLSELELAQAQLLALGFELSNLVRYSAAEMLAQIDAELLNMSPMATFGYELDLIRVHKELAAKGCSFLVVEASTDDLATLVADVVRTLKPVSAQHYGHLLIEDLTEGPPGRMKTQATQAD